MSFLAFVWDISPEIIPGFHVRWYGLLFAGSFLLGYELLKRMYVREGFPEEWTDKSLIYTMVGTIVGARLGHVFFYDWADYKDNLLDIFKIWEGGLASHGAAIGIIVAIFCLSKYGIKKPALWILDRVVITVALAGFLIRLGNFMNSEIYGKPTGSDWGVIFMRSDSLQLPRYPTQFFEGLGYLLVFAFLWYSYLKTDIKAYVGRLFGYFLVLVFGSRFFWEFLKENQVAFEDSMEFNMGQILSIPAVIAGVYFILKAKKEASVNEIHTK